MKNLKNMLAAACMMVVLGVGAVSASTGLLITDRAAANQPCGVKSSFFNQLAGIFVVGAPSFDGIIIVDRAACPSNETDGIIIVDRDGIIITD